MAEEVKSLHFKHAKVKLGSLSLQEGLEILKKLQSHFRLRVDLNRQWVLDQSLSLFSHFEKDAFEFVEEPVLDPKDLKSFTHPFAIDESLRDFAVDFTLENLKAFVIKPSLYGLSKSWKPLLNKNRKLIFSSLFETGVGIFHIAHLSSLLNEITIPMGLGTYHYLKQDLLENPLTFHKGELICPSELHLKEDLLIQIL